jgi:hypothetical protein
MATAPHLSVIVPAHQGERVLPRALAALSASTLPRETWELVVVDDASTDATAAVAAVHADRVVALAPGPTGPRGPAYARNRGAEAARGDLLAFVDADVCVHPDALSRIVAALDGDSRIDALFGTYDARPAAPGLVSQYRNLLHRYTHVRHAGPATTFWAGLGAVRHAPFVAAGGFDALRFPRPLIEDIDLGYRMTDCGCRIVLARDVQGTHLKRWTLAGMVHTDFAHRGVPWMRLLLERRADGRRGAVLNVAGAERASTALMGAAMLALVAAAASRSWPPLLAALLCLGGVALGSRAFFAWLASERGVAFALCAVPLRLLYYAVNVAAAATGLVQHVLATRRPAGHRASVRAGAAPRTP